MLRYGIVVGCVLALSGCTNMAPSENRDADTQAIKDTEAAAVKDIATKDVEKWVQHYSEDAAVLLPNAPAIIGRDNIRAGLKPMMADPNFSLTFLATKAEVSRGGDIGYTRGTYTMTMSDPKTHEPFTEKGKYLSVFRKNGEGKWLIIEDMASSDLPAPPEAH
jgi:ketosteroid isomerase-like protein